MNVVLDGIEVSTIASAMYASYSDEHDDWLDNVVDSNIAFYHVASLVKRTLLKSIDVSLLDNYYDENDKPLDTPQIVGY
jgi:hypothetical protein